MKSYEQQNFIFSKALLHLDIHCKFYTTKSFKNREMKENVFPKDQKTFLTIISTLTKKPKMTYI